MFTVFGALGSVLRDQTIVEMVGHLPRGDQQIVEFLVIEGR
jgi:hypothetical protein